MRTARFAALFLLLACESTAPSGASINAVPKAKPVAPKAKPAAPQSH